MEEPSPLVSRVQVVDGIQKAQVTAAQSSNLASSTHFRADDTQRQAPAGEVDDGKTSDGDRWAMMRENAVRRAQARISTDTSDEESKSGFFGSHLYVR